MQGETTSEYNLFCCSSPSNDPNTGTVAMSTELLMESGLVGKEIGLILEVCPCFELNLWVQLEAYRET